MSCVKARDGLPSDIDCEWQVCLSVVSLAVSGSLGAEQWQPKSRSRKQCFHAAH